MRVKSIGYAYATSAIATRLGKPNGCYFVEVRPADLSPRTLRTFGPFETIGEAEAMAAPLPEAWASYSRRAA